MIVFIVFGFCAIYFFYLKRWTESVLRREQNFGSPSPPKQLPHSATISIIVTTLWAFFLLGGVFWGFTFVRYPEHLSVRGSNIELVLFILLSFAVALSYIVIYRLGEIKGVMHMKSTNLFVTAMQDKP